MRDFLAALFSLYGLIIFGLGVLLAGFVMSAFSTAKSKVARS